MEVNSLNYYLLKDSGLVAKGISWKNWIYHDYAWHNDTENIVWEKLNGYDSSEPEGSPYGIGSTSVMDEIKQISYEDLWKPLENRLFTT